MCELFTTSSLFFRFSPQQVNCSEVFHLAADPTLKRSILFMVSFAFIFTPSLLPFLFLFYLYITMTCPLSTYEHKHTPYIRGKHKYSVQWESLDCLLVTKVGAAVKPLSAVLLTVDRLTKTMTTLVPIHLEMHPAQNKADVFTGMADLQTPNKRGTKTNAEAAMCDWPQDERGNCDSHFIAFKHLNSVRALDKHQHQNKHSRYIHSEMIS